MMISTNKKISIHKLCHAKIDQNYFEEIRDIRNKWVRVKAKHACHQYRLYLVHQLQKHDISSPCILVPTIQANCIVIDYAPEKIWYIYHFAGLKVISSGYLPYCICWAGWFLFTKRPRKIKSATKRFVHIHASTFYVNANYFKLANAHTNVKYYWNISWSISGFWHWNRGNIHFNSGNR